MNNKNLRNLADRPAEERKTIASMGGTASGSARKEHKTRREVERLLFEDDHDSADST
ncbi:MAG: hypothetical protein Q4D48_06165 [Coriobacteriales bacterium]|nr:hypothetical protein [Coriobacteriales bacterium]